MVCPKPGYSLILITSITSMGVCSSAVRAMVSFDVPYEEVERVYIGDQDTFLPRVHPSPSPPG